MGLTEGKATVNSGGDCGLLFPIANLGLYLLGCWYTLKPVMMVNESLLRQIEQGKREWEATLDAISDLICLLDENGRILRANRTIEKWQALSVKQVAGYTLVLIRSDSSWVNKADI